MMVHIQLLLLAVLVACSFTASGSETTLFALTRQQRRAFARSDNRLKHMAAALMEQPRVVLITVLIANTTVNVCFFAVSFFLLENLNATHPVLAWLGGATAPFVLIFFGEVLPKALSLAHAPTLALVAAPVIETAAVALTPVRWLFEHAVVGPFSRLLLPGPSEHPHVTTDELRALVEMSARQGVINVRENEMLQRIVALPETSVRAVMVPRVNIAAVPITADRALIARRFRESGTTKLPVYGRDLDDILGLVRAVSLHEARHHPLRELLKPVHFVPEQANLLQAVQEFRRSGTQMAIVVDEYGGTAGLVALEDVMEHIVGDLADPDEAPAMPPVEVIDANTYRLSGDFSVRSLADYFGIRPGEQRVETLGGFMLSRLGRLPRIGDVVHTANLRLTVERVAARRVETVRVELVDVDQPEVAGGRQP